MPIHTSVVSIYEIPLSIGAVASLLRFIGYYTFTYAIYLITFQLNN